MKDLWVHVHWGAPMENVFWIMMLKGICPKSRHGDMYELDQEAPDSDTQL